MRSSLRNRLLALFLVLVVVVGAFTLLGIEHALADDLLSALDTRLTSQGQAVAVWLAKAPTAARGADALVVMTPCPQFRELALQPVLAGMRAANVIDAAGFLAGPASTLENVRYFAVGTAHSPS